jgi:hypothetical protein
MQSLYDEYSQAMATGNTGYADYLSQIMHGLGSDPIAAKSAGAGLTQGPAAPPPPDTETKGLFYNYKGLGSNLSGAAGMLLGGLGSLFTGQNTGQAALEAGQAASSTASGASDALKVISDIPRLAVIFIGGVLIIVGLLALTRSETITIAPPS